LALLSVQQARAAGFYVDPYSDAATWLRAHPGDPSAARIARSIVGVPMARWFGNWSGDIRQAVETFVAAAGAARQTPVLVSYNIPDRDCGGQSAGGAAQASSYRDWITAFSLGIGTNKAVVVVEPDALAQLDCFKADDGRAARLDLLSYAISRLRQSAPAAEVYLDAGNANWVPADVMAKRLASADIAEAKGFSINVSNFYTTEQSLAYAEAVNAALEKQYGYRKSVIIDTSRNGNGSNGEWCNPAGRKIGVPTAVATDGVLLAWIKPPGDSDGACGTAPTMPAGTFSPDLAIHLIDGN